MGDVTSQVILWDAGTELNQEPGIGADQGPRQKGANTGKAENGGVRNVKDVEFGSAVRVKKNRALASTS